MNTLTNSESPAAAPADDLYRLLGLAPFEPDSAVISSKVRELMREARKYQVGRYAAETQKRLDTLAAATACLLDPDRKQAYDDELRRRFGLPEVIVASTYSRDLTGRDAANAGAQTDATTRLPAMRALMSVVFVLLAVVVVAVLVVTWVFSVSYWNGG